MDFEKKLTAAIVFSLLVIGLSVQPKAVVAASGQNGKLDSIFCAPPSTFDPKKGHCSILSLPDIPTVRPRSAPLDQSRFNKWRIERGVFSAVEMNGIVKE